MGAWGGGAFENDGALDWVYELEAESDTAFLQATLSAVLDEGEHLEADDCERALAAAEIVAALRGSPDAGLPEEATQWVAAHPTQDIALLISTALRVIDRIRSESELQELWGEDGDTLAEWEESLDELVGRLGLGG